MSAPRSITICTVTVVFVPGEEPRLEHAQEDTKAGQLPPVCYGAHANHDYTPEEADAGKKDLRSDLPGEYCGSWLEDRICDEEDERCDTL